MPAELATAPPPRRHSIRRLYDWTVGWADRPGGTWALLVIAFAESSFFPIPPDVLLIALCVGASHASFRFALVCSVGSVAGGAFGWLLGAGAWHLLRDAFIPYVFAQSTFDHVQRLYQGSAFIAILTAAFTPIPYKVFTVAAGVFEVSLPTLLVASAIGRSARFFMVASVFFFFGRQMRVLIERYFDLLTWAFLALGIAGFVTIRYFR